MVGTSVMKELKDFCFSGHDCDNNEKEQRKSELNEIIQFIILTELKQ